MHLVGLFKNIYSRAKYIYNVEKFKSHEAELNETLKRKRCGGK